MPSNRNDNRGNPDQPRDEEGRFTDDDSQSGRGGRSSGGMGGSGSAGRGGGSGSRGGNR